MCFPFKTYLEFVSSIKIYTKLFFINLLKFETIDKNKIQYNEINI